jgi:hypothetical protein
MRPTYNPTFTPWPSLSPYPTASSTPTQSPFPTDDVTSNSSKKSQQSPTQNNDDFVRGQQSRPSGNKLETNSLGWDPTLSPAPTLTRLPSLTPFPTASPTPTVSPFPTDTSSTGEAKPSKMTFSPSSTWFPTASPTPTASPFPTYYENSDSKTTSPWPTYVYIDTFGPTKTLYPTASPTPTASPFPTDKESEIVLNDSRGYGHSCHDFEKAHEQVDEEIVFTYTAESKMTSMEFIHELEIHLLDQISAEALECAPDSPLHVYRIRYAENEAVSDIRSCKTNQPESKACWILQTKFLITTDRSSKTMAKREVLEEIRSQLNHGKLWTDKFDDITFTKYLGPELTEMSFIRTTSPTNDDSIANRLTLTYTFAAIALIFAILFVAIVMFLYFKKLKINQKITQQTGDSDEGSLEITELLSRSRLRLKENMKGNGYDENEYFADSSQRSNHSRKESVVKEGSLKNFSIGENYDRIDSNFSVSDARPRSITSPLPASVEYLPSTGSAVNLEYRERLSPFDPITSLRLNESKRQRYFEESASILAPEMVYNIENQDQVLEYESYKSTNVHNINSPRYSRETDHSFLMPRSPRNQSLFGSSAASSLEKFEELRGLKDYRSAYPDSVDRTEDKLRGKLIV